MKFSYLTFLALLPLALTQTPLPSAETTGVSSALPVQPPSDTPTIEPTSAPVTQPPTSPPTTASPISDSVSVSESAPASANATTVPPTSSPSANISSSVNATMSANMTSSSIMPNATATANATSDAEYPDWYENRDNDLLLDDVDMNLGVPAVEADEQILTLAYMANINQPSCVNLANQYAAGASPDLRRHYADLEYARRKRKRATFSKRCLAISYEIPTFVHWVLPKGETYASWVTASRFETQLTMARAKLDTLGASLKIKRSVYWESANANKFSSNEWKTTSSEYLGFIANAKKQVNGVGSRNLHFFIVQEMGEFKSGGTTFYTTGRANFPGKARNAKEADCIVIARRALPKAGDETRTNSKDTLWSTVPHEVGHWLGLIHLHDSGPGSTGDGCSGLGDRVAGTLRYKAGNAYASSCGGTDMGKGGEFETNIMSYAKGVTYNQARFLPEQRVRASVGWLIRRDGLASGVNTDIRRVYTSKDCDVASKALSGRSNRLGRLSLYPDSLVGPHKRELTVRQTATELQRFCERTDLVIADHDFSPIAENGIYNPDSAALPGDNSQPLPVVEVGKQAEVQGASTGSNFDQVKQEVQARVAGGGAVDKPYVTPAAVTVTAASTPGGGTGKSSAMKQVGLVSGLGLLGLALGGLLIL